MQGLSSVLSYSFLITHLLFVSYIVCFSEGLVGVGEGHCIWVCCCFCCYLAYWLPPCSMHFCLGSHPARRTQWNERGTNQNRTLNRMQQQRCRRRLDIRIQIHVTKHRQPVVKAEIKAYIRAHIQKSSFVAHTYILYMKCQHSYSILFT